MRGQKATTCLVWIVHGHETVRPPPQAAIAGPGHPICSARADLRDTDVRLPVLQREEELPSRPQRSRPRLRGQGGESVHGCPDNRVTLGARDPGQAVLQLANRLFDVVADGAGQTLAGELVHQQMPAPT
jgi:hypothetical protein